MVETFVIYPCEALRPYVHHYWVMYIKGSMVSESIIPPASLKWVFHRSDPFTINGRLDTNRTANVCMTYGQTVHVETDHELNMICVFFQPYATKIVMQMPCSELAGKLNTMDDLDDLSFTRLKRVVLDADSNDDALRLIEDFLLQRIYSAEISPYLKQLQTVSQAIELHPNIRTEQLAEASCLCERQFRTIFKENFGISPKPYLRFNKFMHLHRLIINNPDIGLKDLVFQGDFTDYSHINKDFRHFAGISPSAKIEIIKRVIQSNVGEAYKSYYS